MSGGLHEIGFEPLLFLLLMSSICEEVPVAGGDHSDAGAGTGNSVQTKNESKPTRRSSASCSDSLPDDIPLPNRAPLGPNEGFQWLLDGSPILQGWNTPGHPFASSLIEHAAANTSWAKELRETYGFGAVILNVPGVSGAGTASLDLFQRALAAFTSAGFEVVQYSSITNAGMSTVWDNGNLSRQHPEWSQIMSNGLPWKQETKPALSPASPAARSFTLNRTLRLLDQFGGRAVMLDNSELCPTTGSPPLELCDYSIAALQAWRRYLEERFSRAWMAQCLDIEDSATASLPLPSEYSTSPAFGVFAHWRNWMMASALESFRSPLRERVAPVALIANTGLEWPNMAQATRLQPLHEDAVLTESYETGAAAADKSMLTRAMASTATAPVFNYVGDFKDKPVYNPEVLLAPEQVLSQLASTLAVRAKVWLPYYGLKAKSESRTLVQRVLQFRAKHPKLFAETLELVSPIAAVLSPISTEIRGEPQIGSWFIGARTAGAATTLIADRQLCRLLGPRVRVLLLQNASVMAASDARCIAQWFNNHSSSFLIRTGNSAHYDEVGFVRPQSILPPIGLARQYVEDGDSLSVAATAIISQHAWRAPTAEQWQLTPYIDSEASGVAVVHALWLGATSADCPAKQPYAYGVNTSGLYCCSVPATRSCAGTVCCRKPSTKTHGCQGNPRCAPRTLDHQFGPRTRTSPSLVLRIPTTMLSANRGGASIAIAKVACWAPGLANPRCNASWSDHDGVLTIEVMSAPNYIIFEAHASHMSHNESLPEGYHLIIQ